MKLKYQTVNNLKIADNLLAFINEELLKNTSISPDQFWSGFDKAVHELAPKNRELIKFRDELQNKINEWHLKNKGNKIDIGEYKKFLKEIGYLKDEGPDFKIETKNVAYLLCRPQCDMFQISPFEPNEDQNHIELHCQFRK